MCCLKRKHLHLHLARDVSYTCFEFGLSPPSLHACYTIIPTSSDKSSVPSLLVNETILQPWERRLYHSHSPLGRLPRRCSLSFFLKIEFPQFTRGCRRTQMVLARFVEEFSIHFAKCRVNAALCPSRQKNSLQLIINITKLGNLTVVNRSRDIEKGNRNCTIGTKAKDRRNIVVMRPSIVVPFLDIRMSRRLQV